MNQVSAWGIRRGKGVKNQNGSEGIASPGYYFASPQFGPQPR